MVTRGVTKEGHRGAWEKPPGAGTCLWAGSSGGRPGPWTQGDGGVSPSALS